MQYPPDAYEAYEKARDFFISWGRRRVKDYESKLQERHARKQQESAADKTARRTANATYWIAGFTLLSIVVNGGVLYILDGQLSEMRSSGKDAQKLIDANVKLANASAKSAATADKSLIATQRAWVGAVDATLIMGAINTVVKGTVSYVNSGKEPARMTAYAFEYVYKRDAWNDGTAVADINKRQTECSKVNVIVGDRFAWPTTGFMSYLIHFPEKQIPENGTAGWSDDIINGREILVVQGCIVYEAFSDIHSTAFCYFYDSKIGDITHLNICTVGNSVK